MRQRYKVLGASLAALMSGAMASSAALAQAETSTQKPNIMFIMGDDIGWMQVQAYAEGLSSGETPNIDRIAHEGAKFMDYYAMQSCTSGRTAFATGMYPLRVGLIPPQLPGSPTALLPGTPALAVFLHDLGYTTGEFGKNHLGDNLLPLERRNAAIRPGQPASWNLSQVMEEIHAQERLHHNPPAAGTGD